MYSILCLGPVTLYEKGTLKHFTKRYSIFNISSMIAVFGKFKFVSWYGFVTKGSFEFFYHDSIWNVLRVYYRSHQKVKEDSHGLHILTLPELELNWGYIENIVFLNLTFLPGTGGVLTEVVKLNLYRRARSETTKNNVGKDNIKYVVNFHF